MERGTVVCAGTDNKCAPVLVRVRTDVVLSRRPAHVLLLGKKKKKKLYRKNELIQRTGTRT